MTQLHYLLFYANIKQVQKNNFVITVLCNLSKSI